MRLDRDRKTTKKARHASAPEGGRIAESLVLGCRPDAARQLRRGKRTARKEGVIRTVPEPGIK